MNLKKNTKMKIEINNYDDLLEFIKREDISIKDATEIVCKSLKVISVFEMTKEEVIKTTEYYIENFCKADKPTPPLFLHQKGKEFKITDVFNTDKI